VSRHSRAVVGGSVRATNLPWIIDEKALGDNLGIQKVRLVKRSCRHGRRLAPAGAGGSDQRFIRAGDRERLVFAVLAPGTGLGQAYSVLGTDGRHHPFPSEGGHVEFAPKDELEFDLLKYLKDKLRKARQHRACTERPRHA